MPCFFLDVEMIRFSTETSAAVAFPCRNRKPNSITNLSC